MSTLRAVLARCGAVMDDWLFPEKALCLCCHRAAGVQEVDGLCPVCAKALEVQRSFQEALEADDLMQTPVGLTYAHAAFPYDAQAKSLIIRLKFDSVRAAALPLARAMTMLPSGDEEVLVPVPTTRRRLRERGFNQAEVIASLMGGILGMPMADVLVRRDDRMAQMTLSAQQRRQNLVGRMKARTPIKGKRVLLIDDVLTTGSTAMEAARALTQAGAAGVALFTAARAGVEMPDARRLPF